MRRAWHDACFDGVVEDIMTTIRKIMVLLMVGSLAGCAAMREGEAIRTEDLLVAAGFDTTPLDTDARARGLDDLPPLTMVARPDDGKAAFYYADPYRCGCLYVGDRRAYAKYQQLTREEARGFVGIHGGGEPGVFTAE
jgi:hypothetical protein